MSDTRLIAALRAAVGPAGLLVERSDLARYEADGRGTGGQVLAVVRPGSTAEVSAIVRIAAANGVRLIAQGARTGLVGAGLTDDVGPSVALNLERLSQPSAIDPENRTAEVGAGMLLSTLNEIAGRHGLFFPIDLGADPSIGGMIAANTGGSRFLRYGDVRRNLLAVEMVAAEPSGSVMTFGAPLWKNNTGLDLKQLLVGSSGSLGIITRATLTLQPKPAAVVTAMLALTDEKVAVRVLLALEDAFGTLLTAFEGISGAALRAALGHVPRLRSPFPESTPPYALLIEVSSGSAFDEEQLEERLAAALEPWLLDGAVADAAMDRHGGLWAIRHSIPEALRASGHVIACDIALRRGDVMSFRKDVIERMAKLSPVLSVCDFGHIGDGGIHFNMVWPRSAGELDPALARTARDIVFTAAVDEYGGSFSAEHGIGPGNADYYDRFVPAETRRLAGAVQRLMAPVPIGRVSFEGSAGSRQCLTN